MGGAAQRWLLPTVPVLVSEVSCHAEALGGYSSEYWSGSYSSEYWKVLSCPYTLRKKHDTNQRSSTLLLSQNVERKARYSSPTGKSLAGWGSGEPWWVAHRRMVQIVSTGWILPQLLVWPKVSVLSSLSLGLLVCYLTGSAVRTVMAQSVKSQRVEGG